MKRTSGEGIDVSPGESVGRSDGGAYRFMSVEPTEAPVDATGPGWYRYEIGQGNNIIVGYRQGSQFTVEIAVRENVMLLNARRVGPRGRVHIDISATCQPASRKQ